MVKSKYIVDDISLQIYTAYDQLDKLSNMYCRLPYFVIRAVRVEDENKLITLEELNCMHKVFKNMERLDHNLTVKSGTESFKGYLKLLRYDDELSLIYSLVVIDSDNNYIALINE